MPKSKVSWSGVATWIVYGALTIVVGVAMWESAITVFRMLLDYLKVPHA